jgi:hypothetical protein
MPRLGKEILHILADLKALYNTILIIYNLMQLFEGRHVLLKN